MSAQARIADTRRRLEERRAANCLRIALDQLREQAQAPIERRHIERRRAA